MYLQKVKGKKNLDIWKSIDQKSRIWIRIVRIPVCWSVSKKFHGSATLPAGNNYVLFCIIGARERSARVWAICWPCDQRQDWRIRDVTISGIGRGTCRMILLKTPVQFLWEFRGYSDFFRKRLFWICVESDVSTINIIR